MTVALVLGATGHIGANLVRELIDRGYSVRALVGLTSNLASLKGLDLRLYHGDVQEPSTLDEAMRGVDVLFHCAVASAHWVRDEAQVLRPALEGTENVLRAAARHRVKRVVLTSSCDAVGYGRDPELPLDEGCWNEELHLPHIKARVLQERRAWALADALGLELVAVLPAGVLGPHDHQLTPTTAYTRDLLTGRGCMVPCLHNAVHVRDVAAGHVLAAERGTPGERYILAGENVPAERMRALVERVTGNRPDLLSTSRWALMTFAAAAEAAAWIRGATPLLTRAMVRTIHGRHSCFDSSKARAELGWCPVSAEETLRDTWRWLVRIGQVTRVHNVDYAVAS